MDRPPRDLSEDRLIDGPLIRYAYLIAGMWQVGLVLHRAPLGLQGMILQDPIQSGQSACLEYKQTRLPMQAVLCMMAFFTVYWWHGVPLAWIFNTGNTHWTPDAPPFEGWKCTTGADGKEQCQTLTGAFGRLLAIWGLPAVGAGQSFARCRENVRMHMSSGRQDRALSQNVQARFRRASTGSPRRRGTAHWSCASSGTFSWCVLAGAFGESRS
jgi:hypothetical protein